MTRCRAIRSDGNPCQAYAQTVSVYCFWHDPELRDERLAASSRGGKRRPAVLPEGEVLSVERARAILAGLVEAVATGALDPTTARSVGYLLQIEGKLREDQELGRRLEGLEEAHRLFFNCRERIPEGGEHGG